MNGLQRLLTATVTCSLLTVSPQVQAQDLQTYFTDIVVPANAPEQLADVPGGIVSIQPRSILMLDNSRNQLVMLDLSTHQQRPLPLPETSSRPISLDTDGQSIFIERVNNHSTLYTSIDSLVNSSPHWMTKEPPPYPIGQPFTVVQHGTEFQVTLKAPANKAVVLLPLAGGRLTSVIDCLLLSNGKFIVAWEELSQVQGGIHTLSWAGVFSSDSTLERLALLPTDNAPSLPRRYVALSSDGNVYYQGIDNGRISIEEIELLSPEKSIAYATRRSRSLSATGMGSGFESAVRRAAQEEIGTSYNKRGTFNTISRAEVIDNARSFLTLQWILKPQNYSRPDLPSLCNVNAKQWWLRPRPLEGRQNQTISAVPYRWGGTSTPQSFTERLRQGDLAGAVCTCRMSTFNYCIVPQTAGVDCSGFISNVWKAERHTTSSLKDIAVPLMSISDLKPGDALNRAGSHVRLFLGFTEGPEVKLKTLESAVSCGGVCERTYSTAELNGYVPMRFKGIKD